MRIEDCEMLNRQVILSTRPEGIPEAGHFQIVESPVPDVEDGQLLVRNLYLSVEPAMRGWVSATANYSEPVALGTVMRSFATGRVEESRHAHFKRGDFVTGLFGWQEYAVVPASGVRTITDLDIPLSTSLGVLGLNGLTAYVGLLEIGRPKPGETVVVSTAAGAVGSTVGQIAKLHGCRTVGIAGGAAKVALCVGEFGFDDAIDYKSGDLDSRLARACPAGVDVYFDNTAGAISDAVIRRLNVGARVAICGTASVATWDPPPLGPRIERALLTKRARIEGFLAFDYEHKRPEALRFLSRCIRDGSLRYREEILEGLHEAPGAIARLYRGENMGKLLVRLADA
jgi:NADPH-dependent curcumin reductase CurA